MILGEDHQHSLISALTPRIKLNTYVSDINHGSYKSQVNRSIIEQLLDVAMGAIFQQHIQDSTWLKKKIKTTSWQSAQQFDHFLQHNEG